MDQLTRHWALTSREVEELPETGLTDGFQLRRISKDVANKREKIRGGINVETPGGEPVRREKSWR